MTKRHSIEECVLFRSKMDRLHYADAEPYDPLRAGCLSYAYTTSKCKYYKSAHSCDIDESPLAQYKALLPILQAEPTLICAGGIVWRSLRKCRCANDADLWIVDTSSRALCDKYAHASACVMRCIDKIRKIHGGMVRITHASHHITVQIGTDTLHTIKYQFVLRIYDSIGDLLRCFDFPLAQIAYDGMRYWTTRAGAWCNDNGVCLVDPTRMHPGSYGRCAKYSKCVSVCVVGMPSHVDKLTVGDENSANLTLYNKIWGSDDISAEYASFSDAIYCMDAVEQSYRNSRYMFYGRDGFVATVVDLKPGDVYTINTSVQIKDTFPAKMYGQTRGMNAYGYITLSYWGYEIYDTLLDAGMHPLEIAEYIREHEKERINAINARLRELTWTQDKFPLAPDNLMISHPRWIGIKLGNSSMERCLRLARLRYPFAVLPRDVFLIILAKALLMDNGI